MQTRTYKSRRHRAGFSLVELLIVIAVIGIIAAMAIMTMTDTNKNASVTAAKANAQRIASTFQAGMATNAAGFKTATDVDTAMNAVGIGSHGSGNQSGAWFQLAGISSGMDERKPTTQQAKTYLKWDAGTLIYAPGSSTSFDPTGWSDWGDHGSEANAQQAAAAHNAHLPGMEFVAVGSHVFARPRNQA